MNTKIRKRAAQKKRNRRVEKKRRLEAERCARRIRRRLDKNKNCEDKGPVFNNFTFQYECSERFRATSYGGVGLAFALAGQSGLIDAINRRVNVLKIHLPYHESDHVLNIALNAMCGGTCLDDIERLRNDEEYLRLAGVERIPDPTTEGDFCRRFDEPQIFELLYAYDEARLVVWAAQPEEFFDQATIDMDGMVTPTDGECKEGMDYNGHKKVWCYHPLVVTLANTGEPLRIVNRTGARPSHEGAAAIADQCIELCEGAGFRSILLRGDTDFSQTAYLDGWHDRDVQFVFGYDACKAVKEIAEDLPEGEWKPLQRREKRVPEGEPRARPENVKEKIVVERGYLNLRLVEEHVAETEYQPGECDRPYRLVIVRKTIARERGGLPLFPDEGDDEEYRYFFYISNLPKESATAEDVVFHANDRCDQENLIEQLKNGVHALRCPVDNLHSNWAYMVMASLAWSMKAWLALTLPVKPGPWKEQHKEEKRTLLRMHFKQFLNTFVQIPCQVVKTGRRVVLRLLSWNPWQRVFFRLSDALRC